MFKKIMAQALSHGVIQLSLDYKVIAEYSSLKEAEKQTGIGHGQISRVCSGKRKSRRLYLEIYRTRLIHCNYKNTSSRKGAGLL